MKSIDLQKRTKWNFFNFVSWMFAVICATALLIVAVYSQEFTGLFYSRYPQEPDKPKVKTVEKAPPPKAAFFQTMKGEANDTFVPDTASGPLPTIAPKNEYFDPSRANAENHPNLMSIHSKSHPGFVLQVTWLDEVFSDSKDFEAPLPDVRITIQCLQAKDADASMKSLLHSGSYVGFAETTWRAVAGEIICKEKSATEKPPSDDYDGKYSIEVKLKNIRFKSEKTGEVIEFGDDVTLPATTVWALKPGRRKTPRM